MSIQRYSDHAANERTFLAWVRTSISVTAFGFVVEKFDLFLAFADPKVAANVHMHRNEFGHIAGLMLIVVGIVMILVASWRFYRTAQEIDDETVHPGHGSRVDIALSGLLALLGLALFFYLLHTFQGSA